MIHGKLLLVLDIIVAGIFIAKILIRMKNDQTVITGDD